MATVRCKSSFRTVGSRCRSKHRVGDPNAFDPDPTLEEKMDPDLTVKKSGIRPLKNNPDPDTTS